MEVDVLESDTDGSPCLDGNGVTVFEVVGVSELVGVPDPLKLLEVG